jgi:flagella basal body P-ring formation protein FlgA
LCSPLDASENETTLTRENFQDFFSEIIRELSPNDVEEVTVTDFNAQPQSIRLPLGQISYHLTRQPKGDSPGKKFITATISVNGKEYSTVRMNGTVHFWGTVICLADSLPTDKIIATHDIEADFRDISMLGDDVIRNPEDAIGKKLKRSLQSGSLLYGKLLENPLLVKRGDLVTIVAENKSLRITTKGEVRTDGSLGETVRVKNLTSHRLLQARVIDEGLVQVDL